MCPRWRDTRHALMTTSLFPNNTCSPISLVSVPALFPASFSIPSRLHLFYPLPSLRNTDTHYTYIWTCTCMRTQTRPSSDIGNARLRTYTSAWPPSNRHSLHSLHGTRPRPRMHVLPLSRCFHPPAHCLARTRLDRATDRDCFPAIIISSNPSPAFCCQSITTTLAAPTSR